MSERSPQQLSSWKANHDFFIGIDSDGCAFDTMALKHKECFIPNTIRWFDLQPIARYAREAAEFVNLYSRWRGANRFPALLRTLDLLAARDAVRARGVSVPRLPATRRWLAREQRPGNPALAAASAAVDGEDAAELRLVLQWSQAINSAVAEMVRGVPPFPAVREVLESASRRADMLVVSATPGEALVREWQEHGIARYTALIAGQEMGTKVEHLRATCGHYTPGRALMIGDAPGDLEAARAVGALFCPIFPGAEAESWARIREQDLERFFSGAYGGEYEQDQVRRFEACLPDTPPWEHGA